MADVVWLSLSESDRELLRKSLSRYAREETDETSLVVEMLKKLEPSKPHPEITIGVYGGQVQWTIGNPFPIRICDYDGEKEDLPDLDDSGEWCRLWYEPADAKSTN